MRPDHRRSGLSRSCCSSGSRSPRRMRRADLRQRRSVEDARRHRVRHRRQGRSIVQRRGVERASTAPRRATGRTAPTAASRRSASCCATSSRARRVNIEPAMRAFAERGYDLIIGIGFAQAPIIEAVAKDYPNIHFAIVDGVSELPNVASLVFKEHEGSYLVGDPGREDTQDRHARVSRRHGHRPDPPLREGLRRRREVGQSRTSGSSRTTSA